MTKKFSLMAMVAMMSATLLFTSCFGSFNLTRKVYGWNQSVGDKWVNELVFVVLSIVPVYEVAGIIDVFVLNLIEFWTDENPVEADVKVQKISTDKGEFTITTDANGHKIRKAGSDEIVEFRFDRDENAWSLEAMGQRLPLLQFVGDNQAKVFLADGSTMTVSADKAGVTALQQVINHRAYFAAK
ncbi:MAG: DUF3332 domain-containing protein [Candidatus Symbiothrix sp.]|nr:DUF3332 domain-containing protein [Candidatus Symbiothrix sp.]